MLLYLWHKYGNTLSIWITSMSNVSDTPISTADLWAEGQAIVATLTRANSTTLTISWTLPDTPTAYAGQVVLGSTSPLETHQTPVDGIQYSPSTNLQVPANTIGGAQVVAVNYGAFGDPLTTTSVTVINATPNQLYYAAVYACSNVLQYYPFGSKTYPLTSADDPIKDVEGYTGSIPKDDVAPTNPVFGEVYFNITNNTVYMWTGSNWIPTASVPAISSGTSQDGAAANTVVTGESFPVTAIAGQFFYQTTTHTLFVWNGLNWVKANKDQQGVPMYDKVGVGTTGDLDSRIRLVNSLKAQLGYPAVCVELKEENFEAAIDIALAEFRRRSDSAYTRKHILFTIRANQPSYYLNDPVVGTDKIVDIYHIHRVSTIGLNVMGGDNGIYAQIFYNQFFYGAMVDILSIHMANSLAEEYEKIFAGTLQFEWNEMRRELKVLRKLYKDERVVLECFMEKTEQEILTDRWSQPWVRDWALAKCWEILSNIRGKYANLPGANGGLALNGDMLSQKAETMFTELQRQINDFECGNNVGLGNPAFLLG